MAKTFKNLPQPGSAVPVKRASERDFFDLTDNPQPPVTSASVTQTTPLVEAPPAASTEADNTGNTRHTDNTDNNGNTLNTGNSGMKKRAGSANRGGSGSGIGNPGDIGNTRNILHSHIPNLLVPNETSAAGKPGVKSRDIRQTFVLSQAHLERLRDHVHARRVGGDYNYSQKQALQEALDLLFASTAPISPRPEQVRELEQQRREQIQQGRLSRS